MHEVFSIPCDKKRSTWREVTPAFQDEARSIMMFGPTKLKQIACQSIKQSSQVQ